MQAKIFISHSCKDLESSQDDHEDATQLRRMTRLQYARLVRDKIVEGLSQSKPNGLGFKVLLDRDRFKPGQEWRAKLHYWLGSCDGAVILLSEDSILSEWVRKEATILSWRKSLRSDFLLIPVFLGDLQPNTLKESGLDSLLLTEIQAARLTPDDVEGGGRKVESLPREKQEIHATRLAQKVLARFEGYLMLKGETDLDRWIQLVAGKLRMINPVFLDLALIKYQNDDESWDDDPEDFESHDFLRKREILAHQLLWSDWERLYEAMKAIRHGISDDNFMELVSIVSCQWVDIQAAQKLFPGEYPGHARDGICRRLALNASDHRTAQAYVDRAHCCDPSAQVEFLSKPGGEEWDKELKYHIEGELGKILGLEKELENIKKAKGKHQSAQIRLAERIEQRLKMIGPFYLGLDLGEFEEGNGVVLEEKLHDYKNLTYLLLTGEDFFHIQSGTDRIQLVLPPLSRGKEETISDQEYALKRLIKKR